MNYWLMKTEPDVFSIDDLAATDKEHWDGVRNYQARNFMRDDMKKNDQVLMYHSNTKIPGVVGVATVVTEAYPDHTAHDPEGGYYDPKSSADAPRWFMVDIAYKNHLSRKVTLRELKADAAVEEMLLVRRGNRLSVMPVDKAHFDHILKLSETHSND